MPASIMRKISSLQRCLFYRSSDHSSGQTSSNDPHGLLRCYFSFPPNDVYLVVNYFGAIVGLTRINAASLDAWKLELAGLCRLCGAGGFGSELTHAEGLPHDLRGHAIITFKAIKV